MTDHDRAFAIIDAHCVWLNKWIGGMDPPQMVRVLVFLSAVEEVKAGRPLDEGSMSVFDCIIEALGVTQLRDEKLLLADFLQEVREANAGSLTHAE